MRGLRWFIVLSIFLALMIKYGDIRYEHGVMDKMTSYND